MLTEFLNETNNTGGGPELQRYMVTVIGAEFLPESERYKWKDSEDTDHTRSKKRLLNRLSELKTERAQNK